MKLQGARACGFFALPFFIEFGGGCV